MKSSSVSQMLRFFWGQLARYKRKVIAIILTLVVVAGLQYVIPRLTQYIIDTLIPKQALGPLIWVILLALTLTALSGLLDGLSTYLIGQVSLKAIADLRDRLFKHALGLDMSYYESSKTGDLMVVLTSDINTLQRLISANSLGLIGSLLSAVIVLVLMLMQDPLLTILILLTFPLLFVVNLFFTRRIRAAYRQARTSSGILNNKIQQALTSISLIKSFTTEPETGADFHTTNDENRANQLAATRLGATFSPLIDWLNYLGTALIFGFGAYQVMHQQFTVGGIIAYLAYLSILQAPIRQLTSLIQQVQQAVVSFDRIQQLSATMPKLVTPANATKLPVFHDKISLEHVDFRYQSDVPVLHDVNFDLPHEKMIALVGSSGAGKTTITNLLVRFYDPTAGQVTFDGVPLPKADLESLRDQIAIVSQDVILIDGTIRENLSYGTDHATEAQVWAAADAANISEFIKTLPDGLDAQVGERGIRLSGGQKQRIAIARVFLKDAPIVILDEATASLDNESERYVQDSFDRLMKDRTSLVIAHRLSTVRHADQILVLEGGEVVESGTHEQLINENGRYKQLYDLQFS